MSGSMPAILPPPHRRKILGEEPKSRSSPRFQKIGLQIARIQRTDERSPMAKKTRARVSVVMGSASDWETMRNAVEMLDQLGVPNEHRIVSAHRTPDLMAKFAHEAAERGIEVIIAGAGGAAHLPGMIPAQTWLPVLGVPVETRALKGLDSLLSIAQMPAGVAVGTLAIGVSGAKNAGLLAASIVGLQDAKVKGAVKKFR